jgi:uncharacterized protein
MIEYDKAKDALNLAKHGVSLADAEMLDWRTLKSYHADIRVYGESRQVGYAYLGKRLYAVVYTYRGMTLRIISLRKANKRERKWYENKT